MIFEWYVLVPTKTKQCMCKCIPLLFLFASVLIANIKLGARNVRPHVRTVVAAQTTQTPYSITCGWVCAAFMKSFNDIWILFIFLVWTGRPSLSKYWKKILIWLNNAWQRGTSEKNYIETLFVCIHIKRANICGMQMFAFLHRSTSSTTICKLYLYVYVQKNTISTTKTKTIYRCMPHCKKTKLRELICTTYCPYLQRKSHPSKNIDLIISHI